ncbi:hypothetical protein [Chitinophaga barathri]|uniref:T9SS C-terminal target domain-containing protein n=1 Tax=Chitinophaga barathri TaxID=1647451 RepID=A0A3N4N1P1_9BACT|nr:hypothetical protein [Chitinophaga barathri]RPD41533.1 hypothetical protein EG028_09490 [Chitinophaga barathri]
MSFFYNFRISVWLLGMFCFLIPTQAQVRQLYLDQDADLRIQKIDFFSPSTGYLATNKWVGYTVDSGKTYIKKYITAGNVNYGFHTVNLTFGFNIRGVKAFSKDTLLVYGDYGLEPAILYSTDGGDQYKLVQHGNRVYTPLPESKGVQDICFLPDRVTGYAVSPDGLLKTNNGGLSWWLTYEISGLDHIQLIDATHIVAYTESSAGLYFITDKASEYVWKLGPVYGGPNTGVHFFTPQKGFVHATNGPSGPQSFFTEDGGDTWRALSAPRYPSIFIKDVRFMDASTAIALSSDPYTLYKTTDSGKVWEPLPRSGGFTYANYTHNDLQVFPSGYILAGGDHGLLEQAYNGGGMPEPRAFFTVDTSGYDIDNTVDLVNASSPKYQFSWMLNGREIATSYNASYQRSSTKQLTDTITLIVTNGIKSDTVTQYVHFTPLLEIYSAWPMEGTKGTEVILKGLNIGIGVKAVYFGGVRSNAWGNNNASEVHARVEDGASGNITLITENGKGQVPGFVYLEKPEEVPVTLLTPLRCKTGPVSLTIQRSVTGIVYELVDSLENVFGRALGQGGDLTFTSWPISRSGTYRIRASIPNAPHVSKTFGEIMIAVEQTTAAFQANMLNIAPGEPVKFNSLSRDAAHLQWQFNEDASITGSGERYPPAVSYASPGMKTVTLTAISRNGCRDTATMPAVNIYDKNTIPDVCYIAQPSADGNVTTKDMATAPDGGFLVAAELTGHTTLGSRYGVTVNLPEGTTSYAGNYSGESVLKWYVYMKGGGITATQTDQDGNIYLAGAFSELKYMYFMNGDSVMLRTAIYGDIWGSYSFIMKLDPYGKYLWHTVLHDQVNSRYAPHPKKLVINGENVFLTGTFNGGLLYFNYKEYRWHEIFNYPSYDYNNPETGTYILKLNRDGDLQWGTHIKFDDGNNICKLEDIISDPSGNTFLGGQYEYGMEIYNAGRETYKSFKQSYPGNSTGFFMKYNSSGKAEWINTFNDSSFSSGSRIKSVVADADWKHFYLAGSTEANNYQAVIPHFITHSDGSTIEVRDSTQGFAVYKFDDKGKYRWHNASYATYYARGGTVVLKNQELLVTGFLALNGIADTTFRLTSRDGNHKEVRLMDSEFFVARYDTAGVLKKISKSGRSMDLWHVPDHFLNAGENNFLFGGSVRMYYEGPTSMFNMPVNNPGNVFMKTNLDFCMDEQPPVADAGMDTAACPGTTVRIGTAQATPGYRYYWTSIPTGFVSREPNPLVSPSRPTMYYLTVTAGNGVTAGDSVLVRLKGMPFLGPDTTICPGEPLTIGVADEGGTYEWSTNGSAFITGPSKLSISIPDTTQYIIKAINAGSCTGTRYDTLQVNIKSPLPPSVTLAIPDTLICQGRNGVFRATPANTGIAPKYKWIRNGMPTPPRDETDEFYHIYNMTDSVERVKVRMTTTNGCGDTVTVESNEITLRLIKEITPSVTIAVSDTGVCQGAYISFSANIRNEGTNTRYDWKVNGVSKTWLSNFEMQAHNNDVVTLTVTTQGYCNTLTLFSDTIVVKANDFQAPVKITVTKDQICYGTPVTFTAVSESPRKPLHYKWMLRGNQVGENLPYFTTSTLSPESDVYVIVSDQTPCGLKVSQSNTIRVAVEAFFPEVSLSVQDKMLCKGQPAIYNATATEGARSPVFEWKKNGIAVGNNEMQYTNSTPANGDVVTVEFYDAASCHMERAASQPVTIQVLPHTSPKVTISGKTTLFSGDATVLTASVEPGMDIYGYVWEISNGGGWNYFPNENRSTFSYRPTDQASVIRCMVAGVAACPADYYSNILEFTLLNGDNSREVQLYPTPANSEITLRIIGDGSWVNFYITDMIGNRMLEKNIQGLRGTMTINISSLTNGLYSGNFVDADGKVTKIKFTKLKL